MQYDVHCSGTVALLELDNITQLNTKYGAHKIQCYIHVPSFTLYTLYEENIYKYSKAVDNDINYVAHIVFKPHSIGCGSIFARQVFNLYIDSTKYDSSLKNRFFGDCTPSHRNSTNIEQSRNIN